MWEDPKKEIPIAQYHVYIDERAAVLKSKGLIGEEPISQVDR
jgi:hypothetical protein